MSSAYKIPESVLVVIYTPELEVLLLERADKPGFWQSVTGSKDSLDEALTITAQREVMEETGIDTLAHTLTDTRELLSTQRCSSIGLSGGRILEAICTFSEARHYSPRKLPDGSVAYD